MVAKLLAVPGIEVDPRTHVGLTPLFDASSWGFDKVIQLLHNAGADVDAQSYDHGETPLIQTCMFGYLHSAKLLVKLGADLEIRDFLYQETALGAAVVFDFPDIVHFLVKSGADLEGRNVHNMTVLEVSIEMGHTEAEQILRNALEFF